MATEATEPKPLPPGIYHAKPEGCEITDTTLDGRVVSYRLKSCDFCADAREVDRLEAVVHDVLRSPDERMAAADQHNELLEALQIFHGID